MKNTRKTTAQMAVVEAFNSLLAYKSGEILAEHIVGVAPRVLSQDGLLNGLFAPVQISTRPMYTASLSISHLYNNYYFIGIVEVLWAMGDGGADLQYFRETFKVTARSRDAIWSVVDITTL
jgi:hypothetical protein